MSLQDSTPKLVYYQLLMEKRVKENKLNDIQHSAAIKMSLTGLKRRRNVAGLRKIKDDSDLEDANSKSENSASEEESTAAEGNAGWANSIAKILNSTKPKTKKAIVLSRAKKLQPEETKKPKESKYDFEVDGEIKIEEKPTNELVEKSKQRKNVPLSLRVKPSWKDMERERTLRKVATRGVVQLFNAVRIQQKDLQKQLEEAGPLDSRKDAVLNNINKRKFLDVLMSGSRSKSEAVDSPVKYEYKKEDGSDDDEEHSDGDDYSVGNKKKRKSEWNVLKEDFMTNKKIKHWDEEDDEENNVDYDSSGTEDGNK